MPVSSSVVTSYYQAIMRATPTSAQVAALSTLADTTALTNTLLGSANNSVDPLIRVYQAAFGRVPDSSGLDYWVGVYNAGGNSVASLQAITAGFAGSTEFRNAYDALDNRGYVSALYANVLGRAGDAAGIDYWVGVLGSGVARSTVLREFASSAEFKATTDSLIDSFLTAAANGTQSYSGSLLSGAGNATGSSYTLTADVAGVTGTSGNDTFSGVLGASATYQIGDAVFGGAGTDTLNILDAVGTAAGVVQLSSVEAVNVRTLVASGTDVTEINAADWSGVAALSNASSIADSEFQFSGLAVTTQVVIHGNTDISGNFANTTTADVSLGANNAGSFAGVTTFGTTAVTANATAHITVDGAAAGTIGGVSISLAGNNLLSIDAGATADSFTISGSGSAVLFTTAQLASVNASAYAGSLDLTLNGASEVTVTGGRGNDTLRLGSTFSNNDTFDGGDGTDAIRVSISGFNRDLRTTNVESAELTFTEAAGGTVNASASTVTSYTFAAGTAGNAASLEAAANNSTFNLNDDDLGDVTLDFASGATTTTLNIGSVSGTVGVGFLAVTDVAAVTINAVGVSGAVGGSITTASFDSDVKSLTIATSGGSADLTIGANNVDMSLGGTTALTILSRGSAAITFSNVDLAGSGNLRTVTLNAINSNAADITVGDISGSALTSINLSAVSGADIVVGALDLGNHASGDTQDEVVNITQGTGSNVTVGDITVSGQGTLTINVSQSTSIADVGAITLLKSTNATADAVGKNVTFGAIAVAGSGEVAFNNINMEGAGTGAQINIGNISVASEGGYSAAFSATAALDVDVSSITVSVAASGSANFAAFAGFEGGALGARTVTVGDIGSANFGGATASAIGATTIVVGSGGGVDFGNMIATTGGAATGGAIGAIAIGGSDIGNVTFGTIGASAVGAVSVSGALDVVFGTITATRIGEVNTQQQGVSGAFTIDLSAVTNAAEIKLGIAQNIVISGLGNDVITLTGGRTSTAGNDVIRFTTSTQNTDNIINFIAGAAASGGDQIEVFDDILAGSGLYFAGGTAVVAASDVKLSFASGAAITWTADTNVFVYGTALVSTADLVSSLQNEVTLGAALANGASANYLVVWTDGADSYVSVLEVEGQSTGVNTTTTLASASAATISTTLAVLSGVTPGAFVSANFDFV